MIRLFPALVLLSSPALAADGGEWKELPKPPEAEVETTDTDTFGSLPQRGYFMEIGFRGRYVTVPDSILDIWYFNENDPGWADDAPRPDIRGYGLGLEYVVKGDSANGIFYFEWLDSTMKEGYWDDVEEPPFHGDGDYIVPSPGLGILAFGANYAYELHFVRTAQTDGKFGLSFLVGGGLGMGFMLGTLERWGPMNGVPGYVRHDLGEAPDGDKRSPKIYPMVDINAGLRFNFGDRVVWRVEGGLHDLLYVGSSLGLMF